MKCKLLSMAWPLCFICLIFQHYLSYSLHSGGTSPNPWCCLTALSLFFLHGAPSFTSSVWRLLFVLQNQVQHQPSVRVLHTTLSPCWSFNDFFGYIRSCGSWRQLLYNSSFYPQELTLKCLCSQVLWIKKMWHACARMCWHTYAHIGISFSLKKENPVILNNMDKSQGLYASEIIQRKTTTAWCQLYVESEEKTLNT